MARSAKPWYRKSRDAWFVMIDGKQHCLGKDKKEAQKRFHELMAAPQPRRVINVENDSLVGLFDLFLDWCEKHRPDSYQWYSIRINQFAKLVPSLGVNDLKPFHVQEWIDTKNAEGYKRGCVVAINRALSWAVKQGRIERNPLAGMEKPIAGRRETILTPEQFRSVMALASDEPFRDLLTFVWETGCRPQEVFKLEARHIELGKNRCVLSVLESKGKKKKRVIYTTDSAEAILRKLMKKYPEGKLFRNADGDQWKPNNVACRFKRMDKKLGFRVKLYDLRHGFCTRLLKSGVDPITVATLAGHSDTSMLARVYAHIQNDNEHLLGALKKGASLPPTS